MITSKSSVCLYACVIFQKKAWDYLVGIGRKIGSTTSGNEL